MVDETRENTAASLDEVYRCVPPKNSNSIGGLCAKRCLPVYNHISVDLGVESSVNDVFKGVKPGRKCWVSLTQGFGWYEATSASEKEVSSTLFEMRLGADEILILWNPRLLMEAHSRDTKLWYDVYNKRLAQARIQDPFLENSSFPIVNDTFKLWVKNEEGKVHACRCHLYSMSGTPPDGIEIAIFVGGYQFIRVGGYQFIRDQSLLTKSF